jgi:hypothetical protein
MHTIHTYITAHSSFSSPPPTPPLSLRSTEILIDSVGAGSIIIDPSFVERWLRTHMKSSVAVHSLLVYRKGLLGIKLAAEFMRDHANDATDSTPIDPLRLALRGRTRSQVNSIIDENAGIAADLVDMEIAEVEVEDGDRQGSISDMIAAATATATAAQRSNDMELLSNPPPHGADSPPSPTCLNPLHQGAVPPADQHSTDRDSIASVASVQDRTAIAAAHYAHDVFLTTTLMEQMTARKVPAGGTWLKNASETVIQATSPVRNIMRKQSARSESPVPSRNQVSGPRANSADSV